MRTTSTRLLFQYWDQLRGERSAPERGEIEPGQLRHALLDIFLLENAPEGLNVRLGGTRLCALFGLELKGQPFLDLWPDAMLRVELTRMIETVMDESAGVIAGLSLWTESGDRAEYELLLLPLRHGGKTHARLVGALAPLTPPSWLGFARVERSEIRSMRVIWPSGLPTGGGSPGERRSRFTVLQGGRS